MTRLDIQKGYEGLVPLGSGWKHQKPPRFSIQKAASDMKRAREILLPLKTQIFAHEPGELRPWDNNVTKRHVNLLGGQGSGKGHTARWVTRWCWEKYLEDQARLQLAQEDDTPVSRDFEAWGPWIAQGLNLVHGQIFNMCEDPWFSALKDPERIEDLLVYLDQLADIQIIFAEDLTSALDKLSKKEKNEAASAWFKIRHKLRDATGYQEGLILAILGLHRFHGVPVQFTTDIDLTIFKSASSNPFDADIIKRYVGRDGMKFLEMLEQERFNDPVFKGYGIWYHRGETGVWYNPVYPGTDPFNQLPEYEENPMVFSQDPEQLGPGAPGPVKARYEVGEFLVEPLGSNADPEFFEEVVDQLELNRKDEATAERDKEIFRLSFTDTQNTIAAQTGVTPSRVGQIVREIKERYLGWAGEAAYYARYPQLEFIGGNKPEPDFIDHDTRTVISFKTYDEPALRDTTLWICKRVGKEEMRYSQANGYALEMLIYEMAQKRFYRYTFTLKEQPKRHGDVAPAGDLAQGLNPMAIGPAQDLIKKTLQMRDKVLADLGGDPEEVTMMAFEHTLGELETFRTSGHNLYGPELIEDLAKYIKRYQERQGDVVESEEVTE